MGFDHCQKGIPLGPKAPQNRTTISWALAWLWRQPSQSMLDFQWNMMEPLKL